MHSTSATGLTLSYRRGHVAAFWAVATIGLGAAIAVVGVAGGVETPWVWPLAALAILAPGAVVSGWFEGGIWLWNGVARRAAALLRRYALAVCYWTVIVAVGRTRTGVRQPASRWSRRPAPAGDAGSLSEYVRQSGEAWTLSLLPLMWLLMLLGDDEPGDASPTSTSYTLF